MLGVAPTVLSAMTPPAPMVMPGEAEAIAASIAAGQDGWDTTWNTRLRGKMRTVFDVAEIERGIPVWRASIWAAQYEAVLGVPAQEMSTALVLRHNGMPLAMRQDMWDKYGLGKAFGVTSPLTGAATDRNPALMGAADGVPDAIQPFALDKFLARGGVALACDLALRSLVVPIIQKVDGSTTERAYETGRAGLVPGVILQPSGMFAVLRAAEVGAHYFKAG